MVYGDAKEGLQMLMSPFQPSNPSSYQGSSFDKTDCAEGSSKGTSHLCRGNTNGAQVTILDLEGEKYRLTSLHDL